MFLGVDEVFASMRRERQTEVMDTHPRSAGVHKLLTELYSVIPGNGKNLSPVILVSKIED